MARSAALNAAGRWSSTTTACRWVGSTPTALRRHRSGAPLSDSLSAVGSQLRPGGNLSQALDAALSSPSFVGVAVDRDGKVIGGVLASDVLAAVEAQRAD